MGILQPIRVILADDHAMVREALAQMLQEDGTIEVVGQAADGQSALRLAGELRPDVVILDYSMPGGDPSTIIRQLLRRLPLTKVLILTFHENIHYAVNVIETGAHGYVVKSAVSRELIEAIHAVKAGETFVSPQVSRKVIQHLKTQKKDRAGLDALSQREFDVLRILGAGCSLKECAAQLHISVSAASTYRARLMEKLHMETTAQLIRFALEQRLVG
jgi:two-component system response regulator NreC